MTAPTRVLEVVVDGRAEEDIKEAVTVTGNEGPREGELNGEDAGWRAWAREAVAKVEAKCWMVVGATSDGRRQRFEVLSLSCGVLSHPRCQ